jgi:thiamine biosynthesis protein ThiI
VDLDDPDIVFEVDCRRDEAYVFSDRVEGPGGLPLGSQAPLVALVSGGIDSPVAAWRAMRRGSPVVPLYLDLGAYGGADHRARAEATVAALRRYAPGMPALRVAPAGDAVERLADARGNDRMVQFRRFMLRVAERVARDEGCAGLVTGEALGQKSSQTAANLAAVDAAVDLPVHRPLLAIDKQEIVDAAKRIGTFDDATIDAGCVRIAPDRPVTAADPDVIADNEPDWLVATASEVADGTEAAEPAGDGVDGGDAASGSDEGAAAR